MHVKSVKLIRIIQVFSLTLIVTYSTDAFAYDPFDCLNDVARVDSGITMGLAVRLCSGTWTPEPVKCYQNVSKTDDGIPRGIAIDLCAGAVSSEKTLECYSKASTRQMPRFQATTLCGAKKPDNLGLRTQ
jgi:hypothetical protein